MTPDQVREAFVRALTSVAPEIDPLTLRPDAPYRQECELDSMDFLNVVIALRRDLGVEVPEADYPRLATVNQAVEYLAGRLAPSAAPPSTPASAASDPADTKSSRR